MKFVRQRNPLKSLQANLTVFAFEFPLKPLPAKPLRKDGFPPVEQFHNGTSVR
jgi:hypothetical protein